MSVIVNDRDVRLRATSDRTTPAQDRALLLAASANVIRTGPGGGSPLPEVVTITAVPLNLAGDVTWSAVPALDMNVSGNTLLIAASAFGSNQSVIVTAKIVKEGVTYEAKQTVVKVQDGAAGMPTYTWIKYADSSTGTGISDSPDGKSYIGLAYNKAVPFESDIPGDYTWSLFRGPQGPNGFPGPQGSPGVPGPVGPTGATLYTWIKYADDASGAGLSDDPAGKAYIGLAHNRSTAFESSNPGDYSWALIKGTDGVPGPRGPDGQTTYTWIAYSDSATGANMYQVPNDATMYIGIAVNKATPVEGTNPNDYVWSRFRGADGTQGVPGPRGPDGSPTYTWIAYSDSPNGANMYQVPTATTTYIGIAPNKTTDVESSNPADYVWSKFKGDQGVQGPQGAQGPQGPQGWDGPRGTIDIAVGGYNYWNDSAATNAVIGAGYGYPQNRDRVTLYGPGFAETRFRDGMSWLTIGAYVNGNMLVNGTLSANKVSGGELSGVSINISNQFKVSLSGGTASTFVHAPTIRRGVCDNADVGALPALTATSTGSGPALQANGGSSGNGLNIIGGSNGIVQSGGGTNWLSGLNPSSSNAYSLGAASFLWSAIYSSSSTITTSDERTKKDISDSQLGLAFINDLRTIQYRQTVAERIVRDNWVEVEPARVITDDYGNEIHLQAVMENQKIVEDRPGVRVHFGLPAQQVRQVLEKHGVPDAAMWVLADKNDPRSQQALRYEELIAPLIKAVQELYRRLHLVQLTENLSKGA